MISPMFKNMNFRIPIFCFLGLTGFLFSCQEDADIGNDINEFVYKKLKNEYLWADETGTTDPHQHDKPESIIDALRHPDDHWTHIQKQAAPAEQATYLASSIPADVGTGIELAVEHSTRTVWVIYVTKYSPADDKGIKRGHRLVEINHADAYPNYGQLFSYEIGKPFHLKFLRSDDSAYEIDVSTEILHVPYISDTTIFRRTNGNNIGYLFYDSFGEDSDKAFSKMLQAFQEENVTDLILDLRYNPGGYLSICQHIVSMCYATGAPSDVIFSLLYNENFDGENKSYLFSDYGHRMNFNSIYVLTTPNTASASEAFIIALKPYLGDKLKVIGTHTHGKYVGARVYTEHGYNFYPIVFRLSNAVGVSDYKQGLSADIEAWDDLSPLSYPYNGLTHAALQDLGYFASENIVAKTQNTAPARTLVRVGTKHLSNFIQLPEE